ncbi:hypothetical protein WNB94_16950 [Aquabacterium sp. A3]|uniref:hypothetical protein n=1 Tax=Aquabacterium sp. A3 TaxID=3132829 RepID=UPI003119F956
MSSLPRHNSADSDFPPTEPLPNLPISHHLDRALSQPTIYKPKIIKTKIKIFIATLSATIFWWSAIGIASGHANMAMKRVGVIHISGTPAILFSLAILILAATLATYMIEHDDAPSVDAAYAQMRNRLGFLAALLVVASITVAALEKSGSLPRTDERIGLMSIEFMKNLLTSDFVALTLAPQKSDLKLWSLVSSMPAAAVGTVWFLHSKLTGHRHINLLFRIAATLAIPPLCIHVLYIIAELSILSQKRVTDASETYFREAIALNMFHLTMSALMLVMLIGSLLLKEDKPRWPHKNQRSHYRR